MSASASENSVVPQLSVFRTAVSKAESPLSFMASVNKGDELDIAVEVAHFASRIPRRRSEIQGER
jgi:hypothetical protein